MDIGRHYFFFLCCSIKHFIPQNQIFRYFIFLSFAIFLLFGVHAFNNNEIKCVNLLKIIGREKVLIKSSFGAIKFANFFDCRCRDYKNKRKLAQQYTNNTAAATYS